MQIATLSMQLCDTCGASAAEGRCGAVHVCGTLTETGSYEYGSIFT